MARRLHRPPYNKSSVPNTGDSVELGDRWPEFVENVNANFAELFARTGDDTNITPGGSGSSVIDFGDTPAPEATVAVTGLTDIAVTSHVRAWFQADTMLSNDANDHILAAESLSLATSIPVAGSGFTIYVNSRFALWTKRFRVRWTWY